MFIVFIVFTLGPWWFAYKKRKTQELDLKPLEEALKKSLILCVAFGFMMYLIETFYFTPMISHNRSQGGGDYGLDLRGAVFGFFGVLLNLIGFGFAGVLQFLKAKKE